MKIMAGNNFKQTLLEFEEYNTHVTVLLMKEVEACDEVLKQHLIWPEYAWILLEFDIRKACDFYGPDYSCNINGSGKEHSGNASFLSGISSQFTINVLRDSIKTVALVKNGSNILDGSFSGATGEVKFREGKRLNNISVMQMASESVLQIAQYNSESDSLDTFINLSSARASPQGKTLAVVGKTTILFVVFLCSIFIFLYEHQLLSLHLLQEGA